MGLERCKCLSFYMGCQYISHWLGVDNMVGLPFVDRWDAVDRLLVAGA
jgi:hypothetical protein